MTNSWRTKWGVGTPKHPLKWFLKPKKVFVSKGTFPSQAVQSVLRSQGFMSENIGRRSRSPEPADSFGRLEMWNQSVSRKPQVKHRDALYQLDLLKVGSTIYFEESALWCSKGPQLLCGKSPYVAVLCEKSLYVMQNMSQRCFMRCWFWKHSQKHVFATKPSNIDPLLML